MNFLELAKERYSVRKFTNKRLETEIIDKILEAGYVAPTACNKQPQRILVINNDDSIKKLKKCTVCHFNAPCVFLISYDKNECWYRDYDNACSGEVDVSIVTTHMMLEASSLGVGSCWVMYFIPEAIYEEFSLPKNYIPVALLVMGYPDEDAKPSINHKKYKSKEELIKYNSYK